MTDFDTQLAAELAALAAAGLRRELRRVDSAAGTRVRVGGRELLNFSANDYLGLAQHPALKEAAVKAVEQYGAGSGASRLVCGSLAVHHELEEVLAAFKGTEAALSFSTGFAAAQGAIVALLDKGDVLIVDKLVHACIVDAAKVCGASLRVFRHNDLNDLEAKLEWAAKQRSAGSGQRSARILVVTESVFSMDGDLAPLRDIVELKERFGAWLMVDEAHGTGLFGERRSGLVEEFGLTGRMEIQMATLGKALGAAGGAICGSRQLVDLLVNRARSLVFSTAPAPAAAAAARAGVAIIQSQEGETRRQRLWLLVEELKRALIGAGLPPSAVRAPIVPVVVGAESRAMALSGALREAGVFVPAIRFPTVARGAARLRFTVSAAHTAEDLIELRGALATVGNRQSAMANA
ncbi:MAG: 8-amino-7-oxononanoate synthase [Proteobacteria bacterium]|nr:8-amino-7-oxononanoate synthase [Verrucomicrobiota bacterium]NBU10511.1 8-amino-7-oxononanoate synthase [Pseudomonadota bacterium]